MVHIIEDEDGAPLPEALQFESPPWNAIYDAVKEAAQDYGPSLTTEQLVERVDEAMRRIAPLCLPGALDPPELNIADAGTKTGLSYMDYGRA